MVCGPMRASITDINLIIIKHIKQDIHEYNHNISHNIKSIIVINV